jgi:uncharacterized OB-fold protein
MPWTAAGSPRHPRAEIAFGPGVEALSSAAVPCAPVPDAEPDGPEPHALGRGPAIRVLPRLDELNTFFWISGAEGVLRFLRCDTCRRYVHPPSPLCPYCLRGEPSPEPVSGRATLHSFTVNHQPWIPGDGPYVVGLVTIAEQDDVRLMTNVVDCPVDELRVGMALEVSFEQHDDVWLPLFRPAGG